MMVTHNTRALPPAELMCDHIDELKNDATRTITENAHEIMDNVLERARKVN
jgi:hypothetical protein